MGFLDSIENMAMQKMGQGAGQNAQVAGGLLGALEEHPGGLGGLMNTMQQNGVDPGQVASGQPMSPDQTEQGLQGSGLIEKISERTGLSPETVKIGLATALPLILAHFTSGGSQAPPSSGYSSMASTILGKLL